MRNICIEYVRQNNNIMTKRTTSAISQKRQYVIKALFI